MKEPEIYCLGETVYDIVFDGNKPVSAVPGGSCLNTAVSLGRLGLPVHLVSEISDDAPGRLVIDFLKENKVSTDFIKVYRAGKTALSLAFLDERKEASYTFYKHYPQNRKLLIPEFTESKDYFHFGSFFSLSSDSRKMTEACLHHAMARDCMVMYDPNFRKAHLNDLKRSLPFIEENLSCSDIIRGSEEDFGLIFGVTNPVDVFCRVPEKKRKVLIYTRGGRYLTLITDTFEINLDVPPVNVASTIGAGDSFNAGILFGLFRNKIHKSSLGSVDRTTWKTILETAVSYGSSVCSSYENYISPEFAGRKLSGA